MFRPDALDEQSGFAEGDGGIARRSLFPLSEPTFQRLLQQL